MSEGKDTYGVEPGDAAPSPQPASEPKQRLIDVPLPPPSKPAPPQGRIEAPALLADFEEDADFDKDPELDRIVMGKPVKEPEPEKKTPVEDFVQPGLGPPKVWAIVGVILLVAAMIATGMQPAFSGLQRLLQILFVLYSTLLHTGTGVVAVFIAATLLSTRLGSFELAAARMFAAVGAFSLMLSLQMSLFGVLWLDRIFVLLLASAAYVLLVASTFNLWKKHPLAYVVGSHFFLWLIVAIGLLLTGAAGTAQPATKAPAPAVQTPAVKPAANPATLPGG